MNLDIRVLNNWQQFWMVFHLWHRIATLEQLMKWAKRKRLTGPHQYYRKLLDNENIRLNRYCIRFPQVGKWTYWLYQVNIILFPPPTRYSKGAAAMYRYKT